MGRDTLGYEQVQDLDQTLELAVEPLKAPALVRLLKAFLVLAPSGALGGKGAGGGYAASAKSGGPEAARGKLTQWSMFLPGTNIPHCLSEKAPHTATSGKCSQTASS